MNDEPENREDTPSLSAFQEPDSSLGRSLNTTFKVRDPSERPGRKEKSAIQKFLPPVLGGLAALPLATAILWYGFGKDIGGIGPAVAQYAPWIVPKKLRGSSFRSDGTSGSSNSSYDVGSAPGMSSKQLAGEGFKSTLPSLGSESRPLPPDQPRNKDRAVVSSETVVQPTKSNEPDSPVLEDATNSPNMDKVLAEKPNNEKSPSVAIAKLSQSIKDLTDLKEKWPTIPRERAVQMKAVSDFYGFLCEIAKWTDSPDDEISELWVQHSSSIANMILEDVKFSALTQRCASGEIADVVSMESNDYLVTVIPSGFLSTEQEAAEGSKNLTLETVIAGNPMTIDLTSDNEELISKAKGVEPGRPLLLFLRVKKHDETFTLTAFDFMTSTLPK